LLSRAAENWAWEDAKQNTSLALVSLMSLPSGCHAESPGP